MQISNIKINKNQFKFTKDLCLLMQYAFSLNYQIVLGDASRFDHRGHNKFSKHYYGLAVDLHIFKDQAIINNREDYIKIGLFWESLNHNWGGRFEIQNLTHFEF